MRDHVGRDVGGHVAGLRLDDRQRGQRPAAVLLVQARGALQQAAVRVEDVAGVCLAAGRAAHQQRHLAVGPGVLRQVVVDAQRVAPGVHELLAHGDTGVRRQVLQRGRVRCGGGDDDGVLHRAVLLQLGHHLRHGRLLLADGDVDADQVLALLVDDRVDRDGRLAGLPVADDQLALAAADGDHGVDGLDARLHRRIHRLAHDDARGDALHGAGLGGLDGPLAVDGLAQRVHHPADQRVADRHLDHASGGLDLVALLELGVVAQDQGADRLLFQVEGHAHDAARKLEQLRRQRAGQPEDLGDAVADLHDGADAGDIGSLVEALDLASDDRRDLVGSNRHEFLVPVVRRRRVARPRSAVPAAAPGGCGRLRHRADRRCARRSRR